MSLEKYCNVPCESHICKCNKENLGDVMNIVPIYNDKKCLTPCLLKQCDYSTSTSYPINGAEFEGIITAKDESTLKFEDDNTKNWLLTLLRESSIIITFYKSDGTERIMLATLNSELLPKIELKEDNIDKPKKKRKASTTTFQVFDKKIQEFRSIKWDSIKSINFNI